MGHTAQRRPRQREPTTETSPPGRVGPQVRHCPLVACVLKAGTFEDNLEMDGSEAEKQKAMIK